MKLIFALFVLVTGASSAPIPISGAGTWVWFSPLDRDESVFAGGSNGVDFVSFTYETGSPLEAGPSVGANVSNNGINRGFASIDSIGSFQFNVVLFNQAGGLVDLGGFLDLYDPSRIRVIARADLTGYIVITSFVRTDDGASSGTFIITPTPPTNTPEPTTWVLMGLGLAGLMARKKISRS